MKGIYGAFDEILADKNLFKANKKMIEQSY